MSEKSVEVTTAGATKTVVGGESGPWWVKYTMQAGFLAVLILVLIGIHDLVGRKLPTVAEPMGRVANLSVDMERHLKDAAEAAKKQAEAADRQARAIERWVQIQDYRLLTTQMPGPMPPMP